MEYNKPISNSGKYFFAGTIIVDVSKIYIYNTPKKKKVSNKNLTYIRILHIEMVIWKYNQIN